MYEDDFISIFSINGELVCSKKVSISMNVIVVSESGYEFIVGGNDGKIFKYQLLTLEESNILDLWDKNDKDTRSNLLEYATSTPTITAMSLTPQEGCQELIIGTNLGGFYIFRYSPRLVGNKIFGAIF